MASYTLFEISWEVCNKVGGIHTVLTSKAKTAVDRLGDDYVAIGPRILSESEREVPFDEDPGFFDFTEACRRRGVPARVGRWRTPGSPRTILVEFSQLYEEKDDVLSKLWDDYSVDSLSGTWDYIEPVLFGWAAGRVIEEWWEHFLIPDHKRGIVHAHEWMTASALLYLKQHVPSLGTVFTTHATMLGRALSSLGHSPDDGLGDRTPEELARENNVVAKHSLEGVSAREADVFTTVSEITAKEAELLHRRAPAPVTPNGIDLEVIDVVAGEVGRDEARARLHDVASRFLGQDVGDAALLCISGRYEFHNKGMDLLLDALARLNERKGRRVVLFVLVPAGNSGLRGEYRERLEGAPDTFDGPLGVPTHNLFDEENDAVLSTCTRLGLDNAPDARVKVIDVPIYLQPGDGFLDLPYEGVLRAMDLSCFPSYYEPWGYTPQESLAVGVPTVTTDYAGFGRWARTAGLTAQDGVIVLDRVHVEYAVAVDALDVVLEDRLALQEDQAEVARRCRSSAERTSWGDLYAHYENAHAEALRSVQSRLEAGVPQTRRPRRPHPVRSDRTSPQPRLVKFDVSASLPDSLRPLQRLARNTWWCWDPEAAGIFQELSPLSWEACGHNPVLLLQRVFPEDVQDRASDPKFVAKLERIVERFEGYLGEDPQQGEWTRLPGGGGESGITPENPVAYFCAEFGIQESLRIYSGGLGVLAGDHLKSASDLNLPFVAVGLFYRKGYLTQRISAAGEQIALDADNDPRKLPLEPVREADGTPLEVRLQLPGRELILHAWILRVGRVALYLLDSDVPSNRPEDRNITRNLYGGEHETRLQQEIVLGRGGVRLLRRLGIHPAVFHMNEGHAAFLTLERVAELVRRGMTFEEAREYVRATTLFTTHTPVPAGHDAFGEDVMRRYFSDAEEWVGLPWDRFLALGRAQADEGDFNMTFLALRFSAYRNGVSELHGIASRRLLDACWPGRVEEEVPVDSITNGIHLPTWTHPKIAAALGVDDRPCRGADFVQGATPKKTQAVWRAKQEIKRELLDHVRVTLRRGFLERHDSPQLLNRSLDGLQENALWIGFARRFAPYKRAHLLFQDPERLRALLESEDRPVRILVAGKAHPRDDHGKQILQDIAHLSRGDDFAGGVFLVEDYDMSLARALVQGVDVWLNTPTRMLEASGTSGMKAAANGGLNLSIGDGWWPEGYDGENGWLIADGRVYENQELQDQFDSAALYRLLEEEVVPAFFERDGSGLPSAWLARMARNLKTLPPVFNTDRMVADYLEAGYGPLGRSHAALAPRLETEIRSLVREKQRIRRGFGEIRIEGAEVADLSALRVGETVDVRVDVELGPLNPEDVLVELVLGHSADGIELLSPRMIALRHVSGEDSRHVFDGSHVMERSGSYAYGIRIRPNPEQDSAGSLEDLILWA